MIRSPAHSRSPHAASVSATKRTIATRSPAVAADGDTSRRIDRSRATTTLRRNMTMKSKPATNSEDGTPPAEESGGAGEFDLTADAAPVSPSTANEVDL